MVSLPTAPSPGVQCPATDPTHIVFALCTAAVFSPSDPVSRQRQRTLLQKLTNLRWTYHRVGFVAGLLGTVRQVDPYEVYGLYPPVLGSFLNANIAGMGSPNVGRVSFGLTVIIPMCLEPLARSLQLWLLLHCALPVTWEFV